MSTDRHGESHNVKDPGKQASKAVHAIWKYLEKAPGFGGKDCRLRFEWGVALPDVESPPDMGPDLPRDLILDRRSLSDPKTAVDRMFSFWEEKGGSSGSGDRTLSRACADAFVKRSARTSFSRLLARTEIRR